MNEAPSAPGGATGPGWWPGAYYTSQKNILTSDTLNEL